MNRRSVVHRRSLRGVRIGREHSEVVQLARKTAEVVLIRVAQLMEMCHERAQRSRVLVRRSPTRTLELLSVLLLLLLAPPIERAPKRSGGQ